MNKLCVGGKPRVMQLLLSFVLYCFVGLVFAAPPDDETYVDPQVIEVLKAEGEVEVFINFQRQPAPDNLTGSQSERAKKLTEIRQKEFAAKLKAFSVHLGADGNKLEITDMTPQTVSVKAIIRSADMLEKITRFPHFRSMHYAHAQIQVPPSAYATPSLQSTKPLPPPTKPTGSITTYRSLINQAGAANWGMTGAWRTVATVEPDGPSHNQHIVTFNNSRTNPDFRVRRHYDCESTYYEKQTTCVPTNNYQSDHWEGYCYKYFDGRSYTGQDSDSCDHPNVTFDHVNAVWYAISVAAPKAEIVQFDTSSSLADYKLALQEIYRLVRDGKENIDVVNLSWGGASHDQPCRAASAYEAEVVDLTVIGIPIVAAAGNESQTNKLNDPACHPMVISVGHQYAMYTDHWWTSCRDYNVSAGKIVCSSNSAFFLDFMAPGCGILAEDNRHPWLTDTLVDCGSSFSTPVVAGAIAASFNPGPYSRYSPSEMRLLLKQEGGQVYDARTGAYRYTDVIDMGRAAYRIMKDSNCGGCGGPGEVY